MSQKPLCVVTHWVHPEIINYLEPHCRLVVNKTRETWPRQILFDHLKEADAAMMFMPDWVDAELLDNAPRLKIVGAALKGYDNFDVDALTSRGVWLSYVPDLLTIPTAELTIALMLALGRHVLPGDKRVRSGAFEGWRPIFYGQGLHGSTVGIIGLGRLGQAVAQRLAGWGVKLIGYDIAELPDERKRELALAQTDMPTLLATADWVVCVSPLTPDSKGLLGAAELAAMKPGAFLVNTGRGSCVDEEAVTEALEKGHLAGYAADVFAFEDWGLADRPRDVPEALRDPGLRTVFTPHLGSAVEQVRIDIAMEAARNIVDVLCGKAPRNPVNTI